SGHEPSADLACAQACAVSARSAARREHSRAGLFRLRLGYLARWRFGSLRSGGTGAVAARSPLLLGPPQRDAAGQAVAVRPDRHIGRQLEIDRLGVAAADVEVIEIDHRAQHIEHVLHALVPALLALLLERDAADVLIV